MSGVLELLKALTGGVCLVCLAVTCRVTTDLSKTCISFALCRVRAFRAVAPPIRDLPGLAAPVLQFHGT